MGGKNKKKRSKRVSAAAGGKKPGGPAIKGSILAIIALVVAAVGISAGLGVWKLTADSGGEANSGGKTKTKFPSFVTAPGTPMNTLKAYQGAVDFFDDMEHIPCFCGCGKSAGHKSVRYCFISAKNGDNISFDNHGAGWQLCVDVALDVLEGKEDGKPIQEIRKDIDEKYEDKLDDATPTPPV